MFPKLIPPSNSCSPFSGVWLFLYTSSSCDFQLFLALILEILKKNFLTKFGIPKTALCHQLLGLEISSILYLWAVYFYLH